MPARKRAPRVRAPALFFFRLPEFSRPASTLIAAPRVACTDSMRARISDCVGGAPGGGGGAPGGGSGASLGGGGGGASLLLRLLVNSPSTPPCAVEQDGRQRWSRTAVSGGAGRPSGVEGARRGVAVAVFGLQGQGLGPGWAKWIVEGGHSRAGSGEGRGRLTFFSFFEAVSAPSTTPVAAEKATASQASRGVAEGVGTAEGAAAGPSSTETRELSSPRDSSGKRIWKTGRSASHLGRGGVRRVVGG